MTARFVHVTGCFGIDPRTEVLVVGEKARMRQAFLNMALIAEPERAALKNAGSAAVRMKDEQRALYLGPAIGVP